MQVEDAAGSARSTSTPAGSARARTAPAPWDRRSPGGRGARPAGGRSRRECSCTRRRSSARPSTDASRARAPTRVARDPPAAARHGRPAPRAGAGGRHCRLSGSYNHRARPSTGRGEDGVKTRAAQTLGAAGWPHPSHGSILAAEWTTNTDTMMGEGTPATRPRDSPGAPDRRPPAAKPLAPRPPAHLGRSDDRRRPDRRRRLSRVLLPAAALTCDAPASVAGPAARRPLRH